MLALLVAALLGSATAADLSTTWQARLLDSTGTPLHGAHDLTVSLYAGEADATALWSRTYSAELADGYVSVALSGNDTAGTSLDSISADAGFVGVAVDGAAELGPRQPLGATTEAARTRGVVSIDHSAGCTQPGGLGWDGGTSLMYVCDGVGWVVVRSGTLSIDNGRLFAPAGSGNVGINTTDPQFDLHVYAPDNDVATIAATGTTQGSGVVYVGQGPDYGGGIAYDGDGNPDIVGGNDRITFFNRNNGVDTEVLSYAYNDDTLYAPGTTYTHLSIFAASASVSSSGTCVSCGSGGQILSCSASGLDNCSNNPCDADISFQPQNNRCCSGSNDHTGWSLVAACLDHTP